MTIADLIRREPKTIDPEAVCAEAARAMKAAGVGSLIVVEEGRPIGVVTDRDLVVKVMAEGSDPGAFPVRDAMSAKPIFLSEAQRRRPGAGRDGRPGGAPASHRGRRAEAHRGRRARRPAGAARRTALPGRRDDPEGIVDEEGVVDGYPDQGQRPDVEGRRDAATQRQALDRQQRDGARPHPAPARSRRGRRPLRSREPAGSVSRPARPQLRLRDRGPAARRSSSRRSWRPRSSPPSRTCRSRKPPP